MSTIGFATLQVIPGMRGFGNAVTSAATPQMAAAGTAGGRAFGTAAVAGAVAVVAAGALAGVALFKVGETFDDAADTIRVGTGKTGKVLEGLKQDFREVVRTVPADFGDASEAIAELNKRTGQSGPGLQALAKQALELTRLTGGDLKTNIAGATRVFGDWDIGAKRQGATMDYLFKVSQNTGIGFDSLSSKVVQFGAPLRQLGFSFTESAAMLGKWEKEGVNTEAVLSGMKIGLGKLSKAGEDPVKALRSIQAEIKGAGSAGEANKIAIEAFGQRAGPDMAAAIREGRFDLDSLMKTLKGSKETILGAADDTADFGESWTLLKNRVLLFIEPLATKVFGAVSKGMKWLVDVGAPAAQKFGAALLAKVMPVLRQLGEFITGTAIPAIQNFGKSFVIPALVALGGFIVNTLVPALQNLGGWLQSNSDWLLPIAAAIGTVVLAWKAYQIATTIATAVTEAFKAAQIALKAVLATNPIVLIAIAIAAVVAALVAAYFRFETFRNIVDAVWSGIQTVVSAVVDWFNAYVMPVLRVVFEGLVAYVKFFFTVYQTVWNAVWAVVEKVVAFFQSYVMPVLSFVFNAIANYVKTLLAVYRVVWDAIWKVVEVVIEWFRATAWPIISKVIGWISDRFTELKIAVGIIWSSVKTTVLAVVNWFVDNVWTKISGAIGTIVGGFQTFADDVQTKWDGFLAIFTGLWSKFWNIGKDIVDGIKKGIENAWQGLIDFVMEKVDMLPGFVKDFLGIKSPSKVFMEIGGNVVKGFEIGLKGMGDLADGVRSKLEKAVDASEARINGWLDTQKQVLADAKAAWMDYRDHVMSAITGGVNIGSSWQATTDQQKAITDAQNALAAAQARAAGPNASDSDRQAVTDSQSALTAAQAAAKSWEDNILGTIDQGELFGNMFSKASDILIRQFGKDSPTWAMLREQLLAAGPVQGAAMASSIVDAGGLSGTLASRLTGFNAWAGNVAVAQAKNNFAWGKQMAKDVFSGLGDKIKDERDHLVSLGEKIGDGVVIGFRNKESAFKDAVQSYIATAFRTMEVRSPSRVFARLGEYSGLGYVQGFQSVDVAKAVQDLVISAHRIPGSLDNATAIERALAVSTAGSAQAAPPTVIVRNYFGNEDMTDLIDTRIQIVDDLLSVTGLDYVLQGTRL